MSIMDFAILIVVSVKVNGKVWCSYYDDVLIINNYKPQLKKFNLKSVQTSDDYCSSVPGYKLCYLLPALVFKIKSLLNQGILGYDLRQIILLTNSGLCTCQSMGQKSTLIGWNLKINSSTMFMWSSWIKSPNKLIALFTSMLKLFPIGKQFIPKNYTEAN